MIESFSIAFALILCAVRRLISLNACISVVDVARKSFFQIGHNSGDGKILSEHITDLIDSHPRFNRQRHSFFRKSATRVQNCIRVLCAEISLWF